MTVAGCTTVTRNYLAFARLVGRSWMDHHPASRFTIVVVDLDESPPPAWSHRDIRVVGPEAIGIDRDELRTRAAIYDPAELACSLKARALRLALESADAAVYLDGDIEVLDAMDDLEDLARARGIVLSPHTLGPMPSDGRLPDRFTINDAGVFNGGLVAVGPSAEPFLDWWDNQVRRDCLFEASLGLLADQRWLDFVPAYFDHHVLRDPTFNVAYWNLHERPTSWDGGTLCVGGRRVRCFHYSGLLDRTPWLLTRYTGGVPRIDMRDQPAVARACRRYLAQLRSAGVEIDRAVPYPFARAADTPVDRRARRLWRTALLHAESDTAGAAPPSPFASDGGRQWLDWLRTPAEGDAVSRYLRQVWLESADLQRAYPDLDDAADRAGYATWCRSLGGELALIPPTLLPDHQDTIMDPDLEPGERPRRRPRAPDVRSQQPVDELAEARRALESTAETVTPSRSVRRVVNRMLRDRDQRQDDVARNLAAAVEELAARIAELGERVNRVNDELPEQADRIDALGDDAVDLATAQQEIVEQIDRLEEAIEVEERDRVDGALEQDLITGTILTDAEERLTAEVADLWLRLDKLGDDDTLDDDAEAEAGEPSESG